VSRGLVLECYSQLRAEGYLTSQTGSATRVADTAQGPPAPAKPQTVKKRVCFQDDEDSYSRLGGRKICKMVEVPVEKTAGGSQGNNAPAPSNQGL